MNHMKCMPLVAAAVFCCALAVGCASAETPVTMTVVEPFEGTRSCGLRLKQDATLTIELPENVTTGYCWNAAGNDQVCSVTLESLPPESAPAGEDAEEGKGVLCGAPGRCVARITALRPGHTIVTLEYARQWETKVPPVARLALTIEVVK